MDREIMEKALNECVNKFNWDRVKKVMDFLDWKWITSSDGMKVPSVECMKSEVCGEMFNELSKYFDTHDEFSIATGGFKLSYFKEVMTLDFILEEKYVEYDRL